MESASLKRHTFWHLTFQAGWRQNHYFFGTGDLACPIVQHHLDIAFEDRSQPRSDVILRPPGGQPPKSALFHNIDIGNV